ncbi:TetR family transcriptional regulator [Streptomyces ruber]|uniref:TetR family transcriptional regulator n=2 Tax=Streptomyces TaxID=1883 RepID=A0A918EVM5_9ACTN|nr:TetR/AcrR family transcriptional regulator C-terminal domain-containing protein [Streptomyces ruber]GGQ74428.1 TetR family transcriptional regulator [Streptomyces ruber]
MVRAADRTRRPARASVWLEDGARAERGGQPSGLDRERITATAVRLLDAQGAAKFSMRKLATELNVTAMSVYWYVETKDDLLELALDRVFGEMRVPTDDSADRAGEDWRDQLRALAAQYRELLVRHPWVSPLVGTYLNIGPHALGFSRAVQRVIRRTGLPVHGQAGALAAVFQFVYGFGTIEGHFMERCAAAGVSRDEYFSEAMTAVTRTPRTSRAGEAIETTRALMSARGGDTVTEMYERDFTMALDIVIAGIETMVARLR